MASYIERVSTIMTRKKTLNPDILATELNRCLSIFDLTMLGFGTMAGSGIYVVTGSVTRSVAGPAVFLCYLFSGVAAMFSALCYAEFGARVPKAGSAYVYTYVTMGEPWAFIVGWNMILEYMLAAASVGRAVSGTINTMSHGRIANWSLIHLGSLDVGDSSGSDYPDLVAFFSVFVAVIFVMAGARTSANINSLLSGANLLCLALIVIAGFVFADVDNWTNPAGGFLPYGWAGVFSGSATCFYAYVGFECIAVASEEARNPSRAIPVATCVALVMVCVLYVLCSMVLSLLVPYYDVNAAAPFPGAFAASGQPWALYVVSVGSMFGIVASLIGASFALPRAVYAMASDGLLFTCLSYVNPSTQTPVFAIALFGTLTATLALLVNIEVLVEFLSIGTLMGFAMVSASVLVLRYRTVDQCQFPLLPESPLDQDSDDDKQRLTTSQAHEDIGKLKRRFRNIPILKTLPSHMPTLLVLLMACSMIVFAAILTLGLSQLQDATWWAIVLCIFGVLGVTSCFALLLMYEQNTSFVTFQVPCVPLIPALSMFINIMLMLQLNWLSWVRLACWLAGGLLIYVAYGVHYSVENKPLSIQTSGYSSTIEVSPEEHSTES